MTILSRLSIPLTIALILVTASRPTFGADKPRSNAPEKAKPIKLRFRGPSDLLFVLYPQGGDDDKVVFECELCLKVDCGGALRDEHGFLVDGITLWSLSETEFVEIDSLGHVLIRDSNPNVDYSSSVGELQLFRPKKGAKVRTGVPLDGREMEEIGEFKVLTDSNWMARLEPVKFRVLECDDLDLNSTKQLVELEASCPSSKCGGFRRRDCFKWRLRTNSLFRRSCRP